MEKVVLFCVLDKACKIISARRLLAPIKFVGLTALSVLIKTNFFTLALIAAFAKVKVPKTLFSIPSNLFSSTILTCLYAAE